MNSLCAELGIKVANNPDFFTFRTDTFGIDEARELRQLSSRKAISSELSTGQTGRKIFFITPTRLTLEAQNAFLKTFEDPSPDTYFFLVVREEAVIIPTLLSRMQVTRLNNSKTGMEAEKFLTLPIRDRLLFAKKFVDEEMILPNFLDDLLLVLRKNGSSSVGVESVYNLRRFARDNAVAPRLIIEHLSLVL